MPRSLQKRISTPVLALLAAATLTLTACSGGAKQGGNAEIDEGPLSKYLSALWDGEEWTQEKSDELQKKTEELVAECMSEEGFEYTPNVQNGGVVYSSDEEIDWGSDDFVKQYGYGIVNWPGMEEMQGQGEEYVDPNQEYIESLSESEQQAYYEALSGPAPTEEEMAAMEDGSLEYDWTMAGCYGSAQQETQEEMNGVQAAYEDPEFKELFEATDAMWSGLYDEQNLNDDVAKLNREWADCMAESGFGDYPSPNSVQMALSDEYNELQNAQNANLGENDEWQDLNEADKKKFQEREIEVAVADHACRDKSSYDDKLMEIQFDLEQKFVDEHKAELDALVAKHGVEKKK